MGFALLAAGLAGSAIQGIGAYEQGQAASESAAYQAQVAKNNALVERYNAAQEAQSGAAQEANQGLKNSAQVGQVKAAQGASNIDVNSGSAANVRAAAAALGAEDLMTIRSNTAKKVYGYEVAATGDTAQAGLLESESKQAAIGGDIGALGTFLSGASSVGARYAQWQPFGTA